MKKFELVVAAGSWDHFHKGHEQFVDKAFAVSEKVMLGVTAESMVLKKDFLGAIESFEKRRKALLKYLKKRRYEKRAEVVKLTDIFGPALTDAKIDGIVVTNKTEGGGKLVNKRRAEMGLAPLQLIKVELAKAADGKEISSERVRAGEIDREGKYYFELFEKKKILFLPKGERHHFKKPFGKLKQKIVEVKRKTKVICIGDDTARVFLENEFEADLFVVDLRVQRTKKYKNVEELGFGKSQVVGVVFNRAGTISREMALKIRAGLKFDKKNRVIVVDGEEDLAVLPTVLAAPLGAMVFYGQPNQGIVELQVTEEKKKEALKLLGLLDFD